MARVSFFIDGFNVYHSLKNNHKYRKYLWLDYSKFLKRFVRKGDMLTQVFYFSAFAHWRSPEAVNRHKFLIDAWQNTDVTPVMGNFKEKDRFCSNCKKYYLSHEEKETDVNMALYLLKEAFLDNYDTAILVTNDTDLVPAIKMVRAIFPQKRIGVLYPIGRWSSELAQECHFSKKTRERDLAKTQFPDTITLPSGASLTRPAAWK